MDKILLVGLICLMGACRQQAFTDEEQKLIGVETDGIMSVYTIDRYEDSLFLRRKALPLGKKEVKSELFQVLKQRMLLTVNDTANPGVGIAAPQVGISRQLIAVQRYDKPGEPFEFYIDPKIIYYAAEEKSGPEGCLSVPDMTGKVLRSTEIVIGYRDEKRWTERRDTVKGYTAVIFQHEIDHLHGILFIDKLAKEELPN